MPRSNASRSRANVNSKGTLLRSTTSRPLPLPREACTLQRLQTLYSRMTVSAMVSSSTSLADEPPLQEFVLLTCGLPSCEGALDGSMVAHAHDALGDLGRSGVGGRRAIALFGQCGHRRCARQMELKGSLPHLLTSTIRMNAPDLNLVQCSICLVENSAGLDTAPCTGLSAGRDGGQSRPVATLGIGPAPCGRVSTTRVRCLGASFTPERTRAAAGKHVGLATFTPVQPRA